MRSTGMRLVFTLARYSRSGGPALLAQQLRDSAGFAA